MFGQILINIEVTLEEYCLARIKIGTRDKKFEYGLVSDWYGTVHIGSGLLSLSETRNEVSRYGSSMA